MDVRASQDMLRVGEVLWPVDNTKTPGIRRPESDSSKEGENRTRKREKKRRAAPSNLNQRSSTRSKFRPL